MIGRGPAYDRAQWRARRRPAVVRRRAARARWATTTTSSSRSTAGADGAARAGRHYCASQDYHVAHQQVVASCAGAAEPLQIRCRGTCRCWAACTSRRATSRRRATPLTGSSACCASRTRASTSTPQCPAQGDYSCTPPRSLEAFGAVLAVCLLYCCRLDFVRNAEQTILSTLATPYTVHAYDYFLVQAASGVVWQHTRRVEAGGPRRGRSELLGLTASLSHRTPACGRRLCSDQSART